MSETTRFFEFMASMAVLSVAVCCTSAHMSGLTVGSIRVLKKTVGRRSGFVRTNLIRKGIGLRILARSHLLFPPFLAPVVTVIIIYIIWGGFDTMTNRRFGNVTKNASGLIAHLIIHNSSTVDDFLSNFI